MRCAPIYPAPWLASAIVAALGTWVLFAAQPGLNWLVWTVAGVAALVWSERTSRGHPDRTGLAVAANHRPTRLALLLLAMALAGGAAVTTNMFIDLLIPINVGWLVATVTLLNDGVPTASLGPSGLLLAPVHAGFRALGACAEQFAAAAGLVRAERSVPILRGGALAVPVVAVFFLLLSAADPTLASWRDAAWQALRALAFLPRTVFFVVLALGGLGVNAIAVRQGSAQSVDSRSAVARRGRLTSVERLIVLGAVVALFALFLGLQVSYLFGNPGAQAGSGVTYAAAVHRGFGELTVAATLCAWLVLALDTYSRRIGSAAHHEGEMHESQVKATALVLVGEAGLLLVSAYYRVAAYEAAYGYTLERLYVQVYTVAVGVGLLLLAREIWSGIEVGRLIRRLSIVGALCVVGLAYWNHEAWIARQNIERYRHTGSIDLDYLVSGLGDDALPEVLQSWPQLAGKAAGEARDGQILSPLANPARRRYGSHWYEWNLRRAAADAAVQTARAIRVP